MAMGLHSSNLEVSCLVDFEAGHATETFLEFGVSAVAMGVEGD